MQNTWKKLTTLLLLTALTLTVCMAGFPARSLAESEEASAALVSGDYLYTLDENGNATITRWNGNAVALALPETLDGHPVTGLGDEALDHCSGLTLITIPDSLTDIGANPFTYNDEFSFQVSASHPTLTLIDGVLFEKATDTLLCCPRSLGLTFYEIPQGTKVIGGLALPESLTAIGAFAFSHCRGLTSLTIPNGVTRAGEYAFIVCSDLASVRLSSGMTVLSKGLFNGCKSLETVTIPDGVTTIGEEAFSECAGLTMVAIPASVTDIGDQAFAQCPELTLLAEGDSYAAQYAEEAGLALLRPEDLF